MFVFRKNVIYKIRLSWSFKQEPFKTGNLQYNKNCIFEESEESTEGKKASHAGNKQSYSMNGLI